VEVVKGRKRREINVGIVAAMRSMRIVTRKVLGDRDGSLRFLSIHPGIDCSA
jgi:hypothetical protein